MKFTKILFILVLGSLLACQKPTDVIGPDPTPTDSTKTSSSGTPTNVGEPTGLLASKTIGPEGGSISTRDGQVQLVIPAGAVSKATNITIQPITNYIPNGLGLAYRFSPDGTQFAKPATLTFRYDAASVAVNDPDMLQVGYQRSDRQWQRVSGVQVDTASREISVPMPHFSDWSAYELAKIEKLSIDSGTGKPLEFGQSTRLVVNYSFLTGPDILPLEKQFRLENFKWSVPGGAANGTISPTENQGLFVNYTAPGKYPPQNPVTVVMEATIKNTNKKVYLLKRILIGQDYFTGTFDGVPFNWREISCIRGDKLMNIGGWNENPDQSLQISLVISSAANLKGSYGYGNPNAMQAEFARTYNGIEDAYLSFIYPCGDGRTPPPIISPGSVKITQVDEVDGIEYVKGSLTGTFASLAGECPSPIIRKPLQGEFRIAITK